MRLSAGALEGVGGGYYTLHSTPLPYTPLHSTCTARCIHVLGQTHVSTPFYQTRVQVASCYMYVLVKVLALFYQVLSSYMYELVLAYILLPILEALRERNTQRSTGHAVHTAPCTSY